MRISCIVAVLAGLTSAACQVLTSPRPTIAVDGHIVTVVGTSRRPDVLLQRIGVTLGEGDSILNNGVEVPEDKDLQLGDPIRLQVVRSIPVLINRGPFITTARTVAQAIRDSGYDLDAADLVDPPAETPVSPGMLISFERAATVRASADGSAVSVRTSNRAIGVGMADAGIPLEGLDAIVPSETDEPTDTAEAHLARITDSVLVSTQVIPFESRVTDSAELDLGLEQVQQPGATGLAVASTRIRRVDGNESSRQESASAVLVPPQDRLVVRGTKLVEKTETVDGVSISYWRSMQMYATVYSPCNSGTSDGSCSSGTASGRPAGKGVVAVDPGLYSFLSGQRLYIPGYGFAVIGDVGGGYIIEQNLGISRYKWIDLGFDDNNIQDVSGWMTVYFLVPAPAVIPEVLR